MKTTKAKRESIFHHAQLCSECCVKLDWRNRNLKHICDKHFCKLCSSYVDETHVCYIKPTNPKRVENFLYVVFDIETMRLDENDKEQEYHDN